MCESKMKILNRIERLLSCILIDIVKQLILIHKLNLKQTKLKLSLKLMLMLNLSLNRMLNQKLMLIRIELILLVMIYVMMILRMNLGMMDMMVDMVVGKVVGMGVDMILGMKMDQSRHMDCMVVDMVVGMVGLVVVDNHIFLLLEFYMHLILLCLSQLCLKRIHHRIIRILDMGLVFCQQLIQHRIVVEYLLRIVVIHMVFSMNYRIFVSIRMD
jgi:hypothetical protein